MNIAELFAHIGLKADVTEAQRFLGGITSIKNEIKGAIAGTLSLAAAIKAVSDTINKTASLERFAAETGASTTQLQKWEYVANRVSGSGQAVAESIKAIATNQQKIKLGEGNISGYQLLGINPNQDPFVVLQQISEKIKGMAPAMQRNILSMFGVSTELTATLQLTNKQFDSMASRAYVISPQMIEGMNKARMSLEQIKNATMYFVAELATKLSPEIQRVSIFLANLVGFLIRGVENISKLIQNTIGWRAALIALVAVLTVMNAEFLLSPIGMFTAAILVLMAVLQDIAEYNAGKKSFIGYIMEKFPALKGPLKDTLEIFTAFGLAMKGLFQGGWSGFDHFVQDLVKQQPGLAAVAAAFGDIVKFVDMLTKPKELVQNIGKGYVGASIAPGGHGENIFKAAMSNLQQFGDWLTKGKAPSWTITNNFHIFGNDPQATGRATAAAVQQTLTNAQNQRAYAKQEQR